MVPNDRWAVSKSSLDRQGKRLGNELREVDIEAMCGDMSPFLITASMVIYSEKQRKGEAKLVAMQSVAQPDCR